MKLSDAAFIELQISDEDLIYQEEEQSEWDNQASWEEVKKSLKDQGFDLLIEKEKPR